MDILIVDPKGKWFSHTGRFGFTDPESGTHFPPSTVVKATPTKWLEGQPIFQEVADPTADAPAPAPEAPPAPAPSPAPEPAPAPK